METSTIMDRQTLGIASDGRPSDTREAAPQAASQLRVLVVRMLAGRVVVPRVRIILDGLGSALFDARRGIGSSAFVLLVAAQQLVQPTHEGPPPSSGYAAEYVSLNAKSGEPEGLPDLARAAYWPSPPAVKDAAGENVRKEHTFFLRHNVGAPGCEHTFYDDRSLN